jgi:hypothetical protein
MNITHTPPVPSAHQWRNWDDLENADVQPGSHLITSRRRYYHHGIYLGGRRVVHYAGFHKGFQVGPVEVLALDCFAGGQPVWVDDAPMSQFDAEEVIRRALSRLGENHYRLLTNNCEHFCNWCLYGKSSSEQVRGFMTHPLALLRLVLQSLPDNFLQASDRRCTQRIVGAAEGAQYHIQRS